MAPINNAAFIPVAQGHPMIVRSAEYPTVDNGEVVIKVAAVAINPMDHFIQTMGDKLFSFLKYPYCGGDDLAGTVMDVGSDVTCFKAGDRVFGVTTSFAAREGAFQEYAVLKAHCTAIVPEHVNFTNAAVLGLGICTASCALYAKDQLALEYPTLDPKPTGKTVLIWAGASSVGTNAIQLAVASGYEVFTTASSKNFDYCKNLGASQVFDYKSRTVTEDIIQALQGKTCAGAVAIQRGSQVNCFDVVLKTEGSKFVASTIPGVVPNSVAAGAQAAFVQAGSVPGSEAGNYIWSKFLPNALEERRYRCLPEPLVVGHSLDKVQDTMDMLKSGGTSARKLVVTL